MRLVGSVARGEVTPDSDVDFLVRFAPGRSLADLGELAAALEGLLGVPVHVIAEGGMGERLQTRVLADAVPV